MPKKIFMLVILLTFIFSCTTIKKKENEKIITRIIEEGKPLSSSDIEEAVKFYNMGITEFKNKNYEKSREYYLKAIAVDPEFTDAMDNLGLVYRVLNDYENAIKCYKAAIEIRSDDGFAHQNLAVIYEILEKYNEALKEYEEVIKIEKDSPEGYYGKGRMLLLLDDCKNALSSLKLSEKLYLKEKSEYLSDTRYYLGYCYFLMDKYEDSLNYYLKVYNIFKDDPDINYQIGVSYLKLKNKAEAKKYLKIAEEKGIEISRKIKKLLR